uniref:Uncharacterized protein n=1 Tax=Leersia perrieri TaxID=77586 RepID=A0A0D9UWM1_9ORYZ
MHQLSTTTTLAMSRHITRRFGAIHHATTIDHRPILSLIGIKSREDLVGIPTADSTPGSTIGKMGSCQGKISVADTTVLVPEKLQNPSSRAAMGVVAAASSSPGHPQEGNTNINITAMSSSQGSPRFTTMAAPSSPKIVQRASSPREGSKAAISVAASSVVCGSQISPVSPSTGNCNARRRSCRTNAEINGISVADEDSLNKAMRRTAARNLDEPLKVMEVGQSPILPTSTPTTSPLQGKSLSIRSLPEDSISSHLNLLGVSLGTSSSDIAFSVNKLKNIEVDRLKVIPRACDSHVSLKQQGSNEKKNPFIASDDEDTEHDGTLFAHLVKECSEIGLEEADLSTTISDLLVSARKSKSSKKKERKTRSLGNKSKKIVYS